MSNWAGAGSAPTVTLQAGDLEIELDGKPQYTGANAGLPINAGRYTVKITNALRERLENDPRFSDYNFGSEISLASMPNGGSSGQVDATHEPAVYVVQPLQIQVTINGSQSVKYGSTNYNDSTTINNNNQYSLSYDNIASRDEAAFSGYHLQSGDLTFVSTPGDVGSYQVKLTAAGINHLKTISGIDPDNYDWKVNVADARANFDVTQMPVTITVANHSGGNGQSVVFGQSTAIDPNDYQVTIATEDGQNLTGWTPSAADLQFDGAMPSNVGDSYKVILSAQGLQSIKDKFGTKNYSYSSAGQSKFTVTPAKATLTLSGSDSKIYNGQNASPSADKYTLTLPSGFTHTLTNDDLEVVDNSSDVGDYQVHLKQSVLDAIKAQDDNDGHNYDWTITEKDAKYSITKATATVDFENAHNSQIVDYSDQSQFSTANFVPVISTNNGLTLTVPSGIDLSIADGNFEFDKTGESSITTEPLNVGTYTVKLTDHGLQKINQNNTSNYDWTNATVGTYKINPISITVSGNGNQSATYDGSSFGSQTGLDLDQFKPELDANSIAVPIIPITGKNALTSADYTIKQDGTVVTAPTNAGSYDVYLNENGLKKLKQLSDNFTWTTADEVKVGTFTINQTTAKAELSGSNSKTYDGQTVSVADLNRTGGNIQVTITVKVGNTDKTFDYQLQDGDYIWDAGSTPVDASNSPYVLSLNKDAVLAHLKDKIDQADPSLKDNYNLKSDSLSGNADFTIKQKLLTITANPDSNSADKTYDGTPGAVTLNQLIDGWKVKGLVNDETLNTSVLSLSDFTWDKSDHVDVGDYHISLKSSVLNKLKTDN